MDTLHEVVRAQIFFAPVSHHCREVLFLWRVGPAAGPPRDHAPRVWHGRAAHGRVRTRASGDVSKETASAVALDARERRSGGAGWSRA